MTTTMRKNPHVKLFRIEENVWGAYNLDRGDHLFLDIFDKALLDVANEVSSSDRIAELVSAIDDGSGTEQIVAGRERVERLIQFGALIREKADHEGDVLLIDPPAIAEGHVGMAGPAMALCYLSSSLVQRGMAPAHIVDLRSVSRTIGYDLRTHAEYFAGVVRSCSPKLIGITAVSASINRALFIAKLCKLLFPQAFVVLGGHHASYEWEHLLSLPYIDMVVRGEGELAFPLLVKQVLYKGEHHFEDIPGLSWRDASGQAKTTGWAPVVEDLDTIRIPDVHDHLLNKGEVPIVFARVMSSRGCPYTCSFCSTATFTGRRVRYRSISSVVKEIEFYYRQYGIKGFSFDDDIFTINKKRTLELCGAIRSLPFSHALEFSCNTRLDCINHEILTALYETHFIRILFGVESGDLTVHQRFAKGKRGLEGFKEKIEFMVVHNMQPALNFILGLPGENEESVSKIIELIEGFPDVPCGFNFLNIFPGTPLEKQMVDLGISFVGNADRYSLSAPTISTPTMSDQAQLAAYLRLQWARNKLAVAARHSTCSSTGPAISTAVINEMTGC